MPLTHGCLSPVPGLQDDGHRGSQPEAAQTAGSLQMRSAPWAPRQLQEPQSAVKFPGVQAGKVWGEQGRSEALEGSVFPTLWPLPQVPREDPSPCPNLSFVSDLIRSCGHPKVS